MKECCLIGSKTISWTVRAHAVTFRPIHLLRFPAAIETRARIVLTKTTNKQKKKNNNFFFNAAFKQIYESQFYTYTIYSRSY